MRRLLVLAALAAAAAGTAGPAAADRCTPGVAGQGWGVCHRKDTQCPEVCHPPVYTWCSGIGCVVPV